MTITRWCKNLKSLHWGSWPGGRKGLSPPAVPGFESSCARLSPSRCLTCPLGLQGVQWAVGLVVVRASWPGHPRKSKKKKRTWNHFFNCIIKIDSEHRYLNFFFFLFIYLYSNMINQKKNTEVTLFTILVLCSSSSFLNFSCIIF
jgi:hypothetical protein